MVRSLCESMAGNPSHLITISTGQTPIQECKIVYVMARQHPCQVTGSYMVQGMLRYLCEGVSKGMWKGHLFRIIPMVNVDGVIHGNSRALLSGADPNRMWDKPTRHTTIHEIKHLISQHKKQTTLILDLHSHSSKLGCFFYGNTEQMYYPKIVSKRDCRFVLEQCRWRGGNQRTARRVLYDEMKIREVYTVECSLLGYKKDNRIIQFSIDDYYQMGVSLLQGYFQLINTTPTTTIDTICGLSARSNSLVSQDEYPQVYGRRSPIPCHLHKIITTFPKKKRKSLAYHTKHPKLTSFSLNDNKPNLSINNEEYIPRKKTEKRISDWKEEGVQVDSSLLGKRNQCVVLPESMYVCGSSFEVSVVDRNTVGVQLDERESIGVGGYNALLSNVINVMRGRMLRKQG